MRSSGEMAGMVEQTQCKHVNCICTKNDGRTWNFSSVGRMAHYVGHKIHRNVGIYGELSIVNEMAYSSNHVFIFIF